MAAPKALTNASQYVSIDGIDMHTYGMVAHKVINPIPQPVESSVSIPGRDGAFDFSRVFGSRTITIEGEIIADSHITLLSYVDEINKIIRLRSDGRTYKLIFSDQNDRYWNVRISYSDMQFKGFCGFGKSMRFSMRFLSPKPFAEKTTMSVFFDRLSVNKHVAMYNIGNYKTPVTMRLKSLDAHNIIEDTVAYSEIHNCAWQEYGNCYVTYTSEGRIYPPSGTVINQTNPAIKSTVAIAIQPVVDTTKSYMISCFIYAPNVGAVTLKFETGSQSFEETVTPDEYWTQLSLLIDKTNLAGETNFYLTLECAGGGSNSNFVVNGTMMYPLDDRYDGSISSTDTIPYFIGDLKVSNIALSMFNGVNVFPYRNGEPTDKWNDLFNILGVTKNPVDDGNCLRVYSGPDSYAMSPLIPVRAGINYRISFDYLMSEIDQGGAEVSIVWTCDTGVVIGDVITMIQLTEVTNSFSNYYLTVSPPKGANGLQIRITSSNATFEMYLKNIMVAYEYDAENPPTYQPSVISKQNYSGDINQGNSLNIDNENGYCRMEKNIASNNESVSNAMQYFSGDLFQIEPGYNFISMEDARKDSLTPETESSGTLGVLYSYRARFI